MKKIIIISPYISGVDKEYDLKITSKKGNIMHGTFKDNYGEKHIVKIEMQKRHSIDGSLYINYEVKGKTIAIVKETDVATEVKELASIQ